MFQVHSTAGAVGCLVAGLFMLGLWPTVWALVERRGRIPSHTFLDYGISYTLFTVAAAAALGQAGPSSADAPPFLDALRAADPRLAALAATGGAAVAAADVLLQYGVAFLGVAVGPPAFCAVSLLCSAVAAFFLDGRRNAPALLFPGVAAALAAIALGVCAHAATRAARLARAGAADAETGDAAEEGVSSSGGSPTAAAAAAAVPRADSRAPLRESGAQDSAAVGAPAAPANGADDGAPIDLLLPHPAHRVLQTPPPAPLSPQPQPPVPQDPAAPAPADSVTAAAQQPPGGLRHRRHNLRGADGGGPAAPPAPKRAIQAADSPHAGAALLGFAIVVPGALLNSASYVLFVVAVKDALGVLPAGAPRLDVYTAAALYAMGFGLMALLVSCWAMYAPPLGTQRSSVSGWAGDWRGRALCVLSGALTSGGDMLQFMGGDAAGYAAALLVSAHPLVGMAVGALALRELRGAGWRAVTLVCAQAGAYAGSVALLAASAA